MHSPRYYEVNEFANITGCKQPLSRWAASPTGQLAVTSVSFPHPTQHPETYNQGMECKNNRSVTFLPGDIGIFFFIT